MWSAVHVESGALPGILHGVLRFALHLINTGLMPGTFQLLAWVTFLIPSPDIFTVYVCILKLCVVQSPAFLQIYIQSSSVSSL